MIEGAQPANDKNLTKHKTIARLNLFDLNISTITKVIK